MQILFMATNVDTGKETEPLSSKNVPENEVQYIDFNLKIRCAKTGDGKPKFCSIQNISIDEPPKGTIPEMSVESSQKDIPSVTADPPKPVVAEPAAAEQIPDVKDSECSLCQALADALREKARSTAPRRFHSSVGRRSTVKS